MSRAGRATLRRMADDRPQPNLHRDDFHAWTQVQAEALRAGGANLSNIIDWRNVAEEIEGLGSAERNSVKGHLLQILIHLHKLRSSRARLPRLKWRAEIRLHRLEVELRLTPSIRREVEEGLDRMHRRAALDAQRSLDDYERNAQVDTGHRWSLPELLGERDDPMSSGD